MNSVMPLQLLLYMVFVLEVSQESTSFSFISYLSRIENSGSICFPQGLPYLNI